MNVSYFADIYTTGVLESRCAHENYSPAGSNKVLRIAKALTQIEGTTVEIYSSAYSNGQQKLVEKAYRERIDSEIFYTAVSSFKTKGFRNIWSFLARFRSFVMNYRHVDLYIFYNISFSYILFAFIARINGKNVCLEYEDSVRTTRLGKTLYSSIIGIIKEYLMKKVISFVIACNDELLLSMGKQGFVVPGIIENESEDMVTTPRPYLLYSGGLDKSKGILEFARFFASCSDGFFEKLVITGNGDHRTKKELIQLKLHGVDYKGLVDEQELRHLLKNAGACINPHKVNLHEGGSYPFKIIEYLAYNGCVISTDCGHPINLRPHMYLISDIPSDWDTDILKNMFLFSQKCERKFVRNITNESYGLDSFIKNLRYYL